jgi:polyhydroxybutyrate depolymerase
MEISRWNELADRDGFLVVYPSGVRLRPLPVLPALPAWRVNSQAGRMDDARFLSDLIDELRPAYNLDPARIYVTGYSNGGAMAIAAACALSGRIAAVGTVAAALERPFDGCRDSRPMPLIAFHGKADRFVPYEGLRSVIAVREWVGSWARRNRCRADPASTTVSPDVTRLDYEDCPGNASVVFYTIRDGGHTWPSGKPMPAWLVGKTSREVDATAVTWSFFREHPLPGR